MPDNITYIRYEEAQSVQLDLLKNIDLAQFHFEVLDKQPLVMTIPMEQLRRLHADISARLAEDPLLFVRGSKKDLP